MNNIRFLLLIKIALILLGFSIVYSCRNPSNTPIINLDNINKSITLELSDILKDISVVQIESNFLFSINDAIYVTQNYLIIYCNKYSDMASLHLFSRSGEHIRKLAERGNGPGEFYTIEDFFVD